MNFFRSTSQLFNGGGASTVNGIARDGDNDAGDDNLGAAEKEKQSFFDYMSFNNNTNNSSEMYAPISPHTLQTLDNLDALLGNEDNFDANNDDDDGIDFNELDLGSDKYNNKHNDHNPNSDDHLGASYPRRLSVSFPSMPQDNSTAFMFVPVEMAMIDTSALYMLSPKQNNNADEPWYMPAASSSKQHQHQQQQQQTSSDGLFTFIPMVSGVKIIGGVPEDTSSDNNIDKDKDTNNNKGDDMEPKDQPQQQPLVDEEGKPTAFTVQQIAAMPTVRARRGTITVSKEVDGQKTFRFVPQNKQDDDAYDFVPVVQTKNQSKAVLPKPKPIEEEVDITASLTDAFSSVMPFAGKLFGTMSTTFTSMTKAILADSSDDDDDDDDNTDSKKIKPKRSSHPDNGVHSKSTHLSMPHKHHHHPPHHRHRNTLSHRPNQGDTQRLSSKLMSRMDTAASASAVATATGNEQRAVVAVAARDGGGDMMVCTEDGKQLLVTVPEGLKQGQTFVVNY